MSINVEDGLLTALGYEQVTGLSTAKALTVPSGARYALLQAEGKNIRWRDDGTAPTSTVGMVLTAGDPGFWYNGDALAALSFVEVESTAVLNVSYYK